MSTKERDRLKVIEAVVERRLRQAEAALRLGLSVRQVKRLVRAYRHSGAAGLVSRRRGQPSQRRIADAEREAVLACIRERYRDFGPTLAAEYLKSFHGFTRSVETLRQWMIAPPCCGRSFPCARPTLPLGCACPAGMPFGLSG